MPWLGCCWWWRSPAPRPAAAAREPRAGTTALEPTRATPLLADFDGDHRTDLFWYGPGAGDDHLWLGRPDRNFVGAPVTVGRDYQPLVGDFNGNGRADVLWYGPGAAPDVLWYGEPGGRFAGRTLTVSGTYQPLVGDFNGDHRADVLWYGPGAARDVLWFGRRTGFAARSVTVRGSYQPLVGDFNGDGSADVLWYGPGAARDVLWSGHHDGRFSGRALTVRGSYQPVAGDFDGDGRADVLWYGPGVAGDVVWYGGRSGHFGARTLHVSGDYQPLVGDFGGDGPDDVLWWAPGPAGDVLWFGHRNRRFSARSTTVDLDYARALPLRPDTIANHYDPYGFVAHALGAVDGHIYTNSLEAFQHNWARGFRVFECDQVLLADGTVLLAHDGLERNYGLSKPFQQSTWADLAGHEYLGRYTILRSQDALRLLADHPGAYLILDPKYSRPQIFRTYLRQAAAMGRPDLIERLLPHVADQAELNTLRTYYPLRNYVLALYHTQAQNRYDDPVATDFVRRNRTPAVMMWWRDRDPQVSLAANGRQGRRWRRPFTTGLQAAGAVTYVHSLSDPTTIRRFWDLGVGVYSDDPFPPLGTTAPTLQAPTFSPETLEVSPPA